MKPLRSSRSRRIAGATLAVGALMATAACGGGSKDDKGEGAGFNAAVTGIANKSTKTGGTLKFVNKQDFDSLDPQRQYYGFAWDFARFYTRQLVTYAPKPGNEANTLVPDLATSNAKITDGGKTYTYTLRDGITWEDGSPITAQDIKYGIERIWAKDVISGGPAYLRQVLDPKSEYKGPYKDTSKDKLGLKAIETPDAKTIIFRLPKPNGDFEQMLAMPTGSPVKASKDTGAKYTNQPFSSGPYKVQSYKPGKGAVLVRNDKWKKSSDPIRPALPDKVTVDINSNLDAIDQRLIKGDYDVFLSATGMSQAGRSDAIKKHKGNVDNIPTSFVRYVDFVTKVKPFDNIHCRKAVFYATDYKALQTTRGGPQAAGDIASTMLPKSIAGSDDYDPYGVLKRKGAPDPAKAKDELKQCGKPGGFKTNIVARTDQPNEVEAAETLQESLAKVGIDIQVNNIDGASSASITGSPEVMKKRGYGLSMTGWGPDFPTGQGFEQPLIDGRFIQQTGNYNVSETNDPKINGLFDDALKETDPAKAGEIYKEINHAIVDKAVQLPFLYEKNITWRSSRLTNAFSSGAYNGRYDYSQLGVVK
ncbi:ABC transporter substrate-binding protein [Streptomyces sp. NBS 14/10]|uniref:ABC transporter substrate-binding protein n=1 Tax=Streptomyces sp. NBS 14/10 TaxID=1945643 RepID=UPI000B7E10F7|nr:ABC transporter substrate-binding protein [Streptomyces sp. NBS 14/10]KAK1182308.1 ABC transporter substrate-binding protein [Streptomyces sp. NBS 14/10]NUP36488.1 ABC transporter substrate-binding protein [Streptomyces sp.]NUS89333.1 ABC transporter substrate-binding protein [Streptomyces sp.]